MQGLQANWEDATARPYGHALSDEFSDDLASLHGAAHAPTPGFCSVRSGLFHAAMQCRGTALQVRRSSRASLTAPRPRSERMHDAAADTGGTRLGGGALVARIPVGTVQLGVELGAARKFVFGKQHGSAVPVFPGPGALAFYSVPRRRKLDGVRGRPSGPGRMGALLGAGRGRCPRLAAGSVDGKSHSAELVGRAQRGSAQR